MLPKLCPRARSGPHLDRLSPPTDATDGAQDDLDGERLDRHRGRTWRAWLARVQQAARLPQPQLPAAARQKLSGLDGVETTLAVDDIEPLTQASFRERLNGQLRLGLPATVAEVTSADAHERTYSRAYDGPSWRRWVATCGGDVAGRGVSDPVSRVPVTWVKIFFWSPGEQAFCPLYDRFYTPPGSLSHLVGRAMLETVEADSAPAAAAAAWAHLGWVLGETLGLASMLPPTSPPPTALAHDLLHLAAETGAEALVSRCLSAWRPPGVLDRAAASAASAGDRPMLATLVAHGAASFDIEAMAEDDHQEARDGRSWAPDGGHAGALLRAVTGIFPGLGPVPAPGR